MALRDIFGKALGPPVWRLLDGKVRERVPIYTRPRLGKQDDVYGSFDAGAGLGVKVDLEVAARHPYRRELFIVPVCFRGAVAPSGSVDRTLAGAEPADGPCSGLPAGHVSWPCSSPESSPAASTPIAGETAGAAASAMDIQLGAYAIEHHCDDIIGRVGPSLSQGAMHGVIAADGGADTWNAVLLVHQVLVCADGDHGDAMLDPVNGAGAHLAQITQFSPANR
jgi:hypothetical protein